MTSPGDTLRDNPVMVEVDEDPAHPKPSDSVFDAMPVFQPSIGIHPSDGLPFDATPDPGEDAYAPPLDPNTFVCMRDVDADGTIVRPQCKWYARQIVQDPDIPGVKIIQRWCTHPVIRGTNGAAMVLRDTAVPACELREPPFGNHSDLLDKIDERKVREGRNREYFPMFKTAEDLAAGRTRVDVPTKKA